MANFEKRAGRWRARVYVNGERDSQTFDTKAQAVSWADRREAELTGKRLPNHTLKEALRRYAREVSPTHKGEDWEVVRLAAMERLPMASKRLASILPSDIAQWRDGRLRPADSDTRAMRPATVRREMVLLRQVFQQAATEWGWLRHNPFDVVKKPPASASRKRRISQDEIDRITLALGYQDGEPETLSQRVALSFLFAIETAMRSGEILGLHWIDIAGKAATLPETKNGDARTVPLSTRAREILALLPRGDGPIFGLNAASRDALFRKARDRAKIPDLHFHDTRAEAIWRLSKKLDVLELARMIGHRDLRSLTWYYNADADELADRLG